MLEYEVVLGCLAEAGLVLGLPATLKGTSDDYDTLRLF